MRRGYHHIDMQFESQKFLGFLGAQLDIFLLKRPLVKYWRSKGFKNIVYLDDDSDLKILKNNVLQCQKKYYQIIVCWFLAKF